MADYADAFGLEHTSEAVGAHFRANNHIPAGFVGNADDLAPMAAFLCSPLARFIVGQNIVIDGGQHALALTHEHPDRNSNLRLT